jgi:hypothetical protein
VSSDALNLSAEERLILRRLAREPLSDVPSWRLAEVELVSMREGISRIAAALGQHARLRTVADD